MNEANGTIAISKKKRKTHGMSKTAEFRAWQGLRNRCENPNNKDYADYGGRGVAVSERWVKGDSLKGGFLCFLEDVGRRPSNKHSIDRYPDKNGNYEPGNVRWATWQEQQNNRRSNCVVEFMGELRTIKQWSKRKGINHNTLWHRLNDMGWSIEKSLTYPVRPYTKVAS